MSAFFVDESVEAKVEEKLEMPIGLLEVSLSSDGALNYPSKLHFRDYTYDDALQLGMSTEENVLENMIKILNGCVYEKFDCADLHEKDLEEILVNMFFNFWGKTLEKEYDCDDEELSVLKDKNKELFDAIMGRVRPATIELTASDLSGATEMIDPSFKEPIVVAHPKTSKRIMFQLPRIRHLFIAKEIVEKKYFREEQKFSKLEKTLKYNSEIDRLGLDKPYKSVDPEELKGYENYLADRAKDFLRLRQAQLIVGIDGKKNENVNECLEAYKLVDINTWKLYNSIIEKYRFGIKDSFDVTSPITGKRVTRGFVFQPLDFLPSSSVQSSDGYTVLFGN